MGMISDLQCRWTSRISSGKSCAVIYPSGTWAKGVWVGQDVAREKCSTGPFGFFAPERTGSICPVDIGRAKRAIVATKSGSTRGIFEKILEALAQDLRDRGKLDLTEGFIDGTHARAKKGNLA